MKGGLGNILKQAQEMQSNMQKAQEELAKVEVTGQAGGGLVSVTMNCRHDVRKVSIDPSLFEDHDREMIEDLVAAAMNDAVRKVEETSREKMEGMASEMGLPAGMKLPF